MGRSKEGRDTVTLVKSDSVVSVAPVAYPSVQLQYSKQDHQAIIRHTVHPQRWPNWQPTVQMTEHANVTCSTTSSTGDIINTVSYKHTNPCYILYIYLPTIIITADAFSTDSSYVFCAMKSLIISKFQHCTSVQFQVITIVVFHLRNKNITIMAYAFYI